jgi:hypothetical protein
MSLFKNLIDVRLARITLISRFEAAGRLQSPHGISPDRLVG